MRKSIIIFMILVLGGCATVSYKNSNGEEFNYKRIGTQSLQGLELTKSSQGDISVRINKSVADASAITEVGKIINKE